MTVKKLSWALLFCFLLAFSPTCSAADYRITEAELTTLQSDLNQLSKNNLQLIADLKTSSADLSAARQRLVQYQQELAKLQQDLLALRAETSQTRSDLQTANAELNATRESLIKYDKEVQSEIRRLKLQQIIIGVAAFYVGHSLK